MKRKIFLEDTNLEIAKIKRGKKGFKIVIKNLAMEDMFYTQCIDCTGKNINEGKVVIYTNKIRWEVCGDVERIYFI